MREGSQYGPIVARSRIFTNTRATITSTTTDTSNNSIASVNEGVSYKWRVSFFNIGSSSGKPASFNSSLLTFGVSSSADYTLNPTTITWTGTGLYDLTFTTSADQLTEGNETITHTVYYSSLAAHTNSIVINDTSLTTWTISPSATTVNENTSVTMTVSCTQSYSSSAALTYDTLVTAGTLSFIAASGTPSFANTGTFSTNTFTITTGFTGNTAAGSRTWVVRLYLSGTLVATSATITTPAITASAVWSALGGSTTPLVSPVNEGTNMYVTVTLGNMGYYTTYTATITNSGTATSADFTGGWPTSTLVSGGTASSLVYSITADATTEGSETISATVSYGGYTLATATVSGGSTTMSIADTSVSPTATFSSPTNAQTVNEGSSITFNVTTTQLASSTIYWKMNATGATDADFSSPSTAVSVIQSLSVSASNTASFTISVAADFTTESTESFTISLYRYSNATGLFATSAIITIGDTSLTPTATITSPTIATSGNEGTSLTFNVSSNNSNYTLYYKINVVTGTINDADFSSPSSAVSSVQSFSIGAGTGSFTLTFAADATTEGSEQFTVSVCRYGNGTGVLATSPTITISDTSLDPAPPTYATATISSDPGDAAFLNGGVLDTTVNNYGGVYSGTDSGYYTDTIVWKIFRDGMSYGGATQTADTLGITYMGRTYTHIGIHDGQFILLLNASDFSKTAWYVDAGSRAQSSQTNYTIAPFQANTSHDMGCMWYDTWINPQKEYRLPLTILLEICLITMTSPKEAGMLPTLCPQ